jgi:hypothetical protein
VSFFFGSPHFFIRSGGASNAEIGLGLLVGEVGLDEGPEKLGRLSDENLGRLSDVLAALIDIRRSMAEGGGGVSGGSADLEDLVCFLACGEGFSSLYLISRRRQKYVATPAIATMTTIPTQKMEMMRFREKLESSFSFGASTEYSK